MDRKILLAGESALSCLITIITAVMIFATRRISPRVLASNRTRWLARSN
ncbi:MAG: hypothetical protein IPM31_17860 [Anaerolineae bacterium]|nr:hypothetical protein [Anaerolineae bacterium]